MRASAAVTLVVMKVKLVTTSVPSLRGQARRSRMRAAVALATSDAPVVHPKRLASAITSSLDQPPSAARAAATTSRAPACCNTTSNNRDSLAATSVC
ncbi:MAG: hypothetical protein ACREXS_19465 [Gammaproteobacteria bacterium]